MVTPVVPVPLALKSSYDNSGRNAELRCEFRNLVKFESKELGLIHARDEECLREEVRFVL
jgi:hypothetical protein